MKMIKSVDDTKLMNKMVIKEMMGDLDRLMNNENGIKVIRQIVSGEVIALNKDMEYTENRFSKKEEGVRN